MKSFDKILIFSALTALSINAMAESTNSWALNIENKTSASFLVPELSGTCYPKAFVAQGASFPLPAYAVQAICGKQTGACVADIYTFTGNSCSYPSTKIGAVTLDLSTGAVISSQMNSGYSLNVNGSTLTFN